MAETEIATTQNGSTTAKESSSGAGAAAVGAAIGVLAVGGLIAAAFFAARKKRTDLQTQQQEPAQNFEVVLDDLLESGRIDQEQASGRIVPREIDRADVDLVSMIGEGAFGQVWKGLLDESSKENGAGAPEYLVAVKTVKVQSNGGASAEANTAKEKEALDELLAEGTFAHIYIYIYMGWV